MINRRSILRSLLAAPFLGLFTSLAKAESVGCRPPSASAHIKWHWIGSHHGWNERAEWNDGIWVRWGYCGDCPELCQATYLGVASDQTRPFNRDLDQHLAFWRLESPKDFA